MPTGCPATRGASLRRQDRLDPPHGPCARDRARLPIISKQGKQECGFMEALASAHDLAQWNRGAEIIYAFDGSTWGNA